MTTYAFGERSDDQSPFSFWRTPLEYSYPFFIGAGVAAIAASPMAITLLGMGIANCAGTITVGLNEKYNFYYLKVIAEKCHDIVERHPVLRTICLVVTIVAGHWFPCLALVFATPASYSSSVYEVTTERKSHHQR